MASLRKNDVVVLRRPALDRPWTLVSVAADRETAVRIAAAVRAADGGEVPALSLPQFEEVVAADDRERLIGEFRSWSVGEKRRSLGVAAAPSAPQPRTTTRAQPPWQRRLVRLAVPSGRR